MGWKIRYNIEFKGLSEGLHDFEYEIDDSFFEHFEGSLIEKGKIKANIALEKRSSFLVLTIKIRGFVVLTCDRCLEPYLQKIKNESEVFVKFGEDTSDEGDNVIWVLPEEHHINVSQLIYEYSVLAIPMRHVHPKNEQGERDCNKEMIEKLKIYKVSGKNEIPNTDPRWDTLKNINNN